MDLLTEFRNHWKAMEFLPSGTPVLLAVSGGMDSMVLADLFFRSGIAFGMAHCNFQLRGVDADEDEQHVRDWATTRQIPFMSTRFDTLRIAEERKIGVQEAARDLRYSWLETVRRQMGYARIATAHHADDNAETLLINLFRGTGMAGLHGIPERNGMIIRPLLFASRKMIAAYASTQKVAFREDASNRSDKYLRNAVRLNVLPLLEEYFPDVSGRLNDSIRRFRQAEWLYNEAVQQTLKKLAERRGEDIYVPILKLKRHPAAETLCYELYKTYGFSSAQTSQIMRLVQAESGHFIESDTHRVIRDRDFLVLTSRNSESTDFITIHAVPCSVETAEGRLKFSVEAPAQLSADTNTALIDLDKIAFPLVLRRWRIGDYFYPLGMGMKKKKLSRFFIDQKLALHEKERVWVLESAKRIIWVAGLRPDERFKITPSTKKVLKVELRPK